MSTYVSLDEKGRKESIIYSEVMQRTNLCMNKVFEWLDKLTVQSVNRLWFNLRTFYIKDYERLIDILDVLNIVKERIENEISFTKG